MHLDAIIAIDENPLKWTIANRFDLQRMSAIRPSAVVHVSVSIGHGTVVFATAVVQSAAKIGAHMIINTAASVDHYSDVGSFVHLALGALAAGTAKIGNGAFVDVRSKVCPNFKVGAWAVQGAVGVAVDYRSTNLGIPARAVRTWRRICSGPFGWRAKASRRQ